MVGGAYAPRHRWRRSIQVARLPSYSQGYCSTYERPGPGGVLLGTSTGPLYSKNWLVFSRVDFGGALGVQGPSCERISGPGALKASTISSSKFITKKHKNGTAAGLQEPPGASRGLQGPPKASRSSRNAFIQSP